MRKYLQNHISSKCAERLYFCPHCEKKGTYAFITRVHDKVCEKKMVECPNKDRGCKLLIEQGIKEQHVNQECGFTEVACAYNESLGCQVKMMRKDINKHQTEFSADHIDLTVKSLSIQTRNLTLLKHYCVKQSEQIHALSQEVLSLSEKLKSQQDKLSNLSRLDKQVISLSERHWTLFVGEALQFQLTDYTYNKEGNNLHLFRPFHTHPGGYKMRIGVYVNGYGDGKCTHLSLFTELLQNSQDHQLQWPFHGTVTFELLNQLADDKHSKKTVKFCTIDDMQIGSIKNIPKFFPHSSLGHSPATNTQYLLDDTLYFRVSVKVDNHKPWLVGTNKINMDSPRLYKNTLNFLFFIQIFVIVIILAFVGYKLYK